MSAYVYVDGFNLYYGALRRKSYKWLDLAKFCRSVLPNQEISRIKYFTARIKSRPDDPEAEMRQQAYLSALESIPNLEIHYGHFLSHKTYMRKADSHDGKVEFVEVIKTSEKGSDVNLASHLLRDAFLARYDTAVIISNDSDLLTPIRMVMDEPLHKKVVIICPHKRPSQVLLEQVGGIKEIWSHTLRRSQFPDPVRFKDRLIYKPKDWN